MHWHYDMTAMLAAREADIAHNAHNPSTRDENPQTVRPDSIELVVELLVVSYVTELKIVLRIAF